MIWALVVDTKDFAAFISANPRILAFVQDQRHARGTDEPDGYDHRDPADFHTAPAEGMASGQPNGNPAGRQQSLNGENCTIVLTDVVAFGAHKRTDRDRLIIRKTLATMIQAAMQGFADVWSGRPW